MSSVIRVWEVSRSSGFVVSSQELARIYRVQCIIIFIKGMPRLWRQPRPARCGHDGQPKLRLHFRIEQRGHDAESRATRVFLATSTERWISRSLQGRYLEQCQPVCSTKSWTPHPPFSSSPSADLTQLAEESQLKTALHGSTGPLEEAATGAGANLYYQYGVGTYLGS